MGLSSRVLSLCINVCGIIVIKVEKGQSDIRVPTLQVGEGQMNNIKDGSCSGSVLPVSRLMGSILGSVSFFIWPVTSHSKHFMMGVSALG